jgi:hypothetical protein
MLNSRPQTSIQGVAGPTVIAPPWYSVNWRAFKECALPLINPELVNACAFLFRSREEAEARSQAGGTAFAVSRLIPNSEEICGQRLEVAYLITNRHVVWTHGASVISLNRRDGLPPDIFEREPTDWIVHPRGDDLAATEITGPGFDKAIHLTHAMEMSLICSEEMARKIKIGIGDEVFMVGRFVNHQGKTSNRSAVRFGSISMMPEEIPVGADHRSQLSYAVEMRSRTGFSGSPVMVYRTPNTILTKVEPRLFACLLGVNWGYIIDENGENTWLNGVVPSWKVLELLEVPELKNRLTMAEEGLRKYVKNFGKITASQAASGAFSLASSNENPTHREDFMRLVGAAARKPPQAD